jgi:hypothetical protein
VDTHSSLSPIADKSPSRTLLAVVKKSRDRWKKEARQLKKRNAELLRQVDQLRRSAECNDSRTTMLSREDVSSGSSAVLTQPASFLGHQFSARTIAICCELTKIIGIRSIPCVLKCIQDFFGMELKIPTRDAIRNWICRNGVAIMEQAVKRDDWIWMIDHSVQLGKMCVLVVLGIARDTVPIGRPLQREDMTPLAVLASDSRKKEVVYEQLRGVSEKLGMPLAIISDGASELREAANQLVPLGFSGVCLDDIKHKIANLLKKTLNNDSRFKEFEARVCQTSAAIQQTEIDHLLPPRKKEKCRFMNFGPLIDWAILAQCQVNSPEATPKIIEKLGWISEYEVELKCWQQIRNHMGQILQFANAQGVYIGASDDLARILQLLPAESQQVREHRDAMLAFYRSNEKKIESLKLPSLKIPCSSEVLESGFGAFKALVRNHHRGTFTTLLPAFACLFDKCSAEKITRRFSQIRNKHLKQWLDDSGLRNSTQFRRTTAYRQSRKQLQIAQNSN